MLKNKSE